jgi:dienelactone hydrolase
LLIIPAANAASVPAAHAAKSAGSKAAAKPSTAPDAKQVTAAADSPKLVVADSELRTGADFNWTVTLELTNPGGAGLYLDSLMCDAQDLDPGETRADRTTHIDLSRLVQLAPTLEGGGSNTLQHTGPALAEKAKLTYRMHTHRSDGRREVLEVVANIEPGASQEYTSRFVTVDGKKIEYVVVPVMGTTKDSPALLLIHGHANHARHMLRMARQLANRGFNVAVMSMPGYGLSEGPAELMGPLSVKAASVVLDSLARQPQVDRERLAAWGISRGATVAAELAARRKDLDAVVLQSGIYDLAAVHRGTTLAGFPEAIVAEAGSDSAAWKARSPLLRADQIGAAVLVVHGEKDANVPAAQAHALVAALEARGRKPESKFYPNAGHQVPSGDVQRIAETFLTSHLTQ